MWLYKKNNLNNLKQINNIKDKIIIIKIKKINKKEIKEKINQEIILKNGVNIQKRKNGLNIKVNDCLCKVIYLFIVKY